MIPSPGFVRGLFFCPSGCLIGCSSRHARRICPAPHDCPRSSPAPVLRRSGGSQGHARAAHNIPDMRHKAHKSLVARFFFALGYSCQSVVKARHTLFTGLSAAFLHILRVLPPIFLPDPPGSQPQNAAEPPEPRRIFAQNSSGFRYVFVRVFIGFLPRFSSGHIASHSRLIVA